jgi:hypothetical protein
MRDTIDMAREAGAADIASHGWTSWVGTQSTEFLKRFEDLVRADEREACAKVCEEIDEAVSKEGWKHGTPTDCAEAMRARGNT